MCIQSFNSFFREERSNDAQRGPFSSHTFRTFRKEGGSHPRVSPPSEPRLFSRVMTSSQRTEVVQDRVVYSWRYIQGGILATYPGWCIPATYPGVYNRRVPTHHRVYPRRLLPTTGCIPGYAPQDPRVYTGYAPQDPRCNIGIPPIPTGVT